jgi:hypothetical protein
MRHRRSQLRRGMGLSLMRRGLVDRVGLAVRDPAGRVDLAVPGRVGLDLAVRDPAGRVGLAVRDPAGRVDLGLAGPVDLAHIRDPVGRADLDLEDQVGLDLAVLVGRVDQGMDRVDPADLAVLVGRVDLGTGRVDPVGRVELDLAGRVDRVAQAMNPADLVGPAAREDLGDRGMNRVAPAVRVDSHQRRTRPGVLSTGVVPRWADPGMCHTASARPATVRLLRHHSADGAGMAGPRPERRRLGGTDRRPRVAGAVLRLPVVGTAHGTGRTATSDGRNAISGRSITTGTTRSRCSIRSLGDGASGSSVSGSRCTEITQTPGLWTSLLQVRRPGVACSDGASA